MKNVGSFLAFNQRWFDKNQRILLWLLNTRFVKVWFRRVLRINGERSSVGNNRITQIYPHAIKWGGVIEFRPHPKFGKRIYHAFRPLWWAIHFYDWIFADRFAPKWSYGFSTLTVKPDAGDPGTTSIDGRVNQDYGFNDGTSVAWGTIRGAAGTNVDTTAAADRFFRMDADHANFPDKWYSLSRCIMLFDTSALGAGASISAAVLSVYGQNKSDGLSVTPNADIYTSTPASNTTLAASDFAQIGTTSQTGAPIAYSSLATSAYNDFTFNATGIGNISKTGVSKFAGRNANYDVANVAPTYTAAAASNFNILFADTGGGTQEPKLVVTYTTSSASLSPSSSVSPSSSASPSASVSRSLSPSSSASRSVSPSSSASASTPPETEVCIDYWEVTFGSSASASLSPSSSASRSQSPSASASLSLSPSASASRSLSPSASESASISPSASLSLSASPSSSVSASPSVTSSVTGKASDILAIEQDNDLLIRQPLDNEIIAIAQEDSLRILPKESENMVITP